MSGLLSVVNSTEYKGFTIKEWSIVQFAKLSPVLTAVAKDYETQDVQFSSFSEALSGAAEDGTLGLTKSAMAFLAPLTERAPEILKISLGVTQEKLEAMSFSDGVVLLLLTMKINLEHISGFFVSLAEERNNAAN